MAPIELRTNAAYKEVVKDSTTLVLERVLSSWTLQLLAMDSILSFREGEASRQRFPVGSQKAGGNREQS